MLAGIDDVAELLGRLASDRAALDDDCGRLLLLLRGDTFLGVMMIFLVVVLRASRFFRR